MKEVIQQLRFVKEKLAYMAKNQVPELAFDVKVLEGCINALSAHQATQEKKYLASYHFKTARKEGWGHTAVQTKENLKTDKGIKEITDYLAKEIGGNIVIVNIIELEG